MAYKRKTVDEFTIQGNYGYGEGWEDLTSEDTRKAVREQLKCYQENEGGNYRIIKRRIPIMEAGDGEKNILIQA